MNPENSKLRIKIKILSLLTVILILTAGFIGWRLGRSSVPINTSQTPTTSSDAAVADVRSLVTYTLPDGWKEATCPGAVGSVFIIPAGAKAIDCDDSPSSPIKISIDPTNSDHCNDLQNVQNVRKHICISLFIHDKKSLKAETIYNQDSSYKKETSIDAYYINTGKGAIKVEYIHNPNDNEYQTGLDQLARSVQIR